MLAAVAFHQIRFYVSLFNAGSQTMDLKMGAGGFPVPPPDDFTAEKF